MDAIHAVLLGIIEGLTEFLPVSSTGHLILAEHYIHFKDTAEIFTVSVQSGAIFAVIWHYRKDLSTKIGGFFRKEPKNVAFIKNISLATVPALIAGFLLKDKFDEYAKPSVVATALILGAVVLWLVDKKYPPTHERPKPNLDKLTTKEAIYAGLAQCAALIPGVSRSGASIVGGMIGGLNRVNATAFSFYLAIPVLLIASVYKLIQGRGEIVTSVDGGATNIIIGTVVSFAVALVAISWLIKYVSGHSFKLFIYYRIILGILVLLLLY
jgi:undecaprenyl-diphosphatase